jgi:SAM-dependent methyltransferase
MGKNHIHAVSTFTDHLKALPLDLRGMRVLDIGVWTGGTSLLLAAMGAEVVAVEEVKKYCDCLEYVASAFGIRNLIVKHVSLYDCTGPDYDDRFDFVLFPGVLYHLSDPIIALRILFNALRDGGTLLLQSKAIDSPQSICYYQVHRFSEADSKGDLRGKRWSWFFPSSPAVANMLQDVGFMDATVTRVRNGVLAAVAKRVRHVEMTRAGLALRHIR